MFKHIQELDRSASAGINPILTPRTICSCLYILTVLLSFRVAKVDVNVWAVMLVLLGNLIYRNTTTGTVL